MNDQKNEQIPLQTQLQHIRTQTKGEETSDFQQFLQKEYKIPAQSSRQRSQQQKIRDNSQKNTSLTATRTSQNHTLFNKPISPMYCLKERQAAFDSKEDELSSYKRREFTQDDEREILCEFQKQNTPFGQKRQELSPMQRIPVRKDDFIKASKGNQGQFRKSNDLIVKKIVYNGNIASLQRVDKVQEKVQSILNSHNNKKNNLNLTLSALSPQRNEMSSHKNRIVSSREYNKRNHERFGSPETPISVNSERKMTKILPYQFVSGLKLGLRETKEVIVDLSKISQQKSQEKPVQNKQFSRDKTSFRFESKSINQSDNLPSNFLNDSPFNLPNQLTQNQYCSNYSPIFHNSNTIEAFIPCQTKNIFFTEASSEHNTFFQQHKTTSVEDKTYSPINNQYGMHILITPLKSMKSADFKNFSDHNQTKCNETTQVFNSNTKMSSIPDQEINKPQLSLTPKQSKSNLIAYAFQGSRQNNKQEITAENPILKKPSFDKPLQTSTTPERIIAQILAGDQDNDIFDTSISMNQFKIEGELGKGAYATVKKAVDKNTGEIFALKIYQKFTLNQPNKMRNVKREMSILKRLNHINIIRLHAAFQDKSTVVLVQEYSSNLSLNKYLKNKFERRVPEIEAKLIFRQLVKGIEYCHQNNILHRDIKLDNILIEDSNKQIKIIDFGFSICSTTRLKVSCGTLAYMAPEIISKIEYCGKKADIWALGIVLYALVCGRFPFRGFSDSYLCKKIINCSYEATPVNISSQCGSLLKRILKFCPQDRPDCREILNDPWFE